VKFNWNQTGMPAALVSRLGPKHDFSEFKTVLNDAGNHVMQAVDAESMARELVESGGREVVEVVRELTASLANVERELEASNRRYERLVADLERRGIRIEEPEVGQRPAREPEPPEDVAAEWDEWDRKFRSLLG